MDGSDALRIEAAEGLSAIDMTAWNAVANPPGEAFNPFLAWEFLEALEASGCASAQQGWTPAHLTARDAKGVLVGAAPLYLKAHSQGEYVFDHAWADALQRAGGRYYPKLQCAVPFTPVPGRRLLAADARVREELAHGMIALARQTRASSVHLTFCEDRERSEIERFGFLKRTGVQFHWLNAGYADFDAFLAALSSQKRKNLRKERARAQEGLRIRRLVGDDIKARDWDFFFACYMDTGGRKWGRPYLNRDFFQLVGERMSERVVLFVADCEGKPIASALNLLGSDTLYGRYWGRKHDVPFLHFELCYYQAIEMAIELRLARVEAGAQGEHKLARGYEPAATYSAHWIAHPGLRDAIAHYLRAESPAIVDEIEALGEHTPFKKLEC
ncbi:MAG: N-acetyltransferase [Hyphomonadaceae bacterium]|nr:N-acetyltransferase [Hyphomonadaceae bacterium]